MIWICLALMWMEKVTQQNSLPNAALMVIYRGGKGTKITLYKSKDISHISSKNKTKSHRFILFWIISCFGTFFWDLHSAWRRDVSRMFLPLQDHP